MLRVCQHNKTGVWFFYEVSPVHVEFQERRRGLLPFLTSVCAIVGGIFSVRHNHTAIRTR
jgi:hypothetical protein